jgi:hypothetical protein
MTAKVWIVGEGNNELGRPDGRGNRQRGVLESLLARTCASGWRVTGKTPWNLIQKFRAGGARTADPGHGDYLNVLGLVLAAYEEASDAVVFSRDVDSDPDREGAIAAALAWIRDEAWSIEVIGGVAKPALEGSWRCAPCRTPMRCPGAGRGSASPSMTSTTSRPSNTSGSSRRPCSASHTTSGCHPGRSRSAPGSRRRTRS